METDVRSTGADRREGDAVRNARHRITLLAETVGTRHPDYATGLNQLALLLIMQGEPEQAEPLLRDALEIRRVSLGDAHPDYATNLSSLGGLLWARGQLDEAEPLLRRASEIRQNTLGASHPKTVVSRNSLEQLLQARQAAPQTTPTTPTTEPADPPRPSLVEPLPIAEPSPFFPWADHPPDDFDAPDERAEPETPLPDRIEAKGPEDTPEPQPAGDAEVSLASESDSPHHAEPEPEPVTTPLFMASGPRETPAPAETEGLDDPDSGRRLSAVRVEFAAVGEALAAAAEAMRSLGVLPAEALVDRGRGARGHFDGLAGLLTDEARGLGLPESEAPLKDLEGLGVLLERVGLAAESRRETEALRGRVLPVLDRFDRLSCPSNPDFAPMAACRSLVGAFRDRVETRPREEWADEAGSVLDGSHPAVALLEIVSADESATDERWAEWFDRVEAGFGTPLAVAAARFRFTISAP